MQFKMQDSKTLGSEIIELKKLSQKEEYDKVTIRAQVVKLAEPAAVGRGLTKQEVTIADSTEAALLHSGKQTSTLSVWGNRTSSTELSSGNIAANINSLTRQAVSLLKRLTTWRR